MAARTRVDSMALTISAGVGKLESRSPAGRNYRYTVGVASDATGARIRFDYHASISDASRGVDQLDRDALLFAFWAFTSDAASGQSTFADFCGDFGYDTDSISARNTWKACRASLVKFRRLFHDVERFTPEYVLDQLAAEGVA